MTLVERMESAAARLIEAAERMEAAVNSLQWANGAPVQLKPDTRESLLFRLHLVEHGCAERGGFGNCEEAMRLFRNLPPEDQVIIA